MVAKIYLDLNKITNAIANNPPAIILPVLARKMGVSEQTMMNNLAPLLDSGRVIRANLGSKGKPIYVYYLAEQDILVECKAVKSCSNCRRETWQRTVYTYVKGVYELEKDMTKCNNCGMILYKGQVLELFGSGETHTYTTPSEIIDHLPEGAKINYRKEAQV